VLLTIFILCCACYCNADESFLSRVITQVSLVRQLLLKQSWVCWNF